MMKEQVALYAKRLFDKTSELLGTDRFHIAGGVLRTYVEDFKVIELGLDDTDVPIYSKDVDCFFDNGAAYFLAKKSLEDKGYTVEKERTNSVVMEKAGHTTYDLVYLEYAFSGKSIIADFDFTNCCIAIGKDGLSTSTSFWEDVQNRKLVINNSKIPYHSIARAGKFMKKGYSLSDEDKIRLFDNAASSPYGPYEEDEYESDMAQSPVLPYVSDTRTAEIDRDDIPF